LHSQAPLYDRDMEPITTFILAGGKSTRMGTDKALLQLGGRSLIAHSLDLARSAAAEVKIIGDAGKFSRYGEVIQDVYPDRGPLGGIHAALSSTHTDCNLILGVDLPFLPAEFVNYLSATAQASGAVVTLPSADGRLQPLCAIYRKQFGALAERALVAGKNKIDALFPETTVRLITDVELAANGFSSSIFRNLNTPEDWESAKQEIRSKLDAAGTKPISTKAQDNHP
jgi:molybdenum cofactor guanylyltransferase